MAMDLWGCKKETEDVAKTIQYVYIKNVLCRSEHVSFIMIID